MWDKRSGADMRSPTIGRAAFSRAGAALVTAPAISSAIASEAAHARREGWANRAQTDQLKVREEARRRKSERLSNAYLATNPRCSIGKTCGGSRRLERKSEVEGKRV